MKVAMCSACMTKGTKDKPLLVTGDGRKRISACCKAKIVLVKEEQNGEGPEDSNRL